MNEPKKRLVGVIIFAFLFALVGIFSSVNNVTALRGFSDDSHFIAMDETTGEILVNLDLSQEQKDKMKETGNVDEYLKEAEIFKKELEQYRQEYVLSRRHPLGIYILFVVGVIFSILCFVTSYGLFMRKGWTRKLCFSTALVGGFEHFFALWATYKALLPTMYLMGRIQELLAIGNPEGAPQYDYSNFTTFLILLGNSMAIMYHLAVLLSITLVFVYFNRPHVKEWFAR